MQQVPKVDFVRDDNREYSNYVLYVKPNDLECRKVVDAVNHRGITTIMIEDISVSPPPPWIRGVPTLHSRLAQTLTEGVYRILQALKLIKKQNADAKTHSTTGESTLASSGLFEDDMWLEVDETEQQAWRRKKSLDARPGQGPGHAEQYHQQENQFQRAQTQGMQNTGVKPTQAVVEHYKAQRVAEDQRFSNRNTQGAQGERQMPQERHDMRTEMDSNNALEKYKAQRASMEQRVMTRNTQLQNPGHMR
jgi:hypothetical protein